MRGAHLLQKATCLPWIGDLSLPAIYKLISYWTAPPVDWMEKFKMEYAARHIPAAGALPHLRRMVLTRTAAGLGGAPAYYRTVEVEWDSKKDCDASTSTGEWAALIEDTVRLIDSYGVSTHGARGEAQEYT